ncbi:MAG: ribosome-associated translation inhibitor RaiA [Planctomycetota bacterium]
MNVEISGRHVQVTAGIEEYAREKASRVAKYLKTDVRVQVVLEKEGDKYQVEMIVSGYRGPVIVSRVQHDELFAAVDLAIDKLEQQLRKVKGRRQARQGGSMAGEPLDSPDSGEGDDSEVSYEDVIDEELNK